MTKFDELTIKEKISYTFAAVAFVLGWILIFLSFCADPFGVIAESVLWVMGQTFVFVGSVLGISQHYAAELGKFKSEVKTKLDNLDSPKPRGRRG